MQAPNNDFRDKKNPSSSFVFDDRINSAPVLLPEFANAIHETYMSESGGVTMITIPSQGNGWNAILLYHCHSCRSYAIV